jgi:hypothetical protein
MIGWRNFWRISKESKDKLSLLILDLTEDLIPELPF